MAKAIDRMEAILSSCLKAALACSVTREEEGEEDLEICGRGKKEKGRSDRRSAEVHDYAGWGS